MAIYLKKLKGNDYMLVNEYGLAVREDGTPAYHPVFYTKKEAEKLPYPKYSEKAK
jgi:hypothetical protein